MIATDCYQDLTRKNKIKGLTANSWLILILSSFLCWFLFLFYAIPFAIIMFIVLFTLEYFDEDIYTILALRFKFKTKKYFS